MTGSQLVIRALNTACRSMSNAEVTPVQVVQNINIPTVLYRLPIALLIDYMYFTCRQLGQFLLS